jgi:hypothetical protein
MVMSVGFDNLNVDGQFLCVPPLVTEGTVIPYRGHHQSLVTEVAIIPYRVKVGGANSNV